LSCGISKRKLASPGDVLHHLAAKTMDTAFAVHQLHAEDEVAQAADRRPTRPGKPGGHCAAHGGRTEVRRLAGQALSPCRQRRLQFCQWRTATRRDHQLGRFVVDDAGMTAGLQYLTTVHSAIEILAAAAANSQWPAF
jgi:hypothetical protein